MILQNSLIKLHIFTPAMVCWRGGVLVYLSLENAKHSGVYGSIGVVVRE